MFSVKKTSLIILAAIATSAAFADTEIENRANTRGLLKVYLPRTKVINNEGITLGDITCLTSFNLKLQKQAESLKMGRCPFPGEKLTITRQTILSRLATVEIFSKSIKFLGSESVIVRRDKIKASPEELIALAKQYLKDNPIPNIHSWGLAKKPQELLIPDPKNMNLKCILSTGAPRGHVKLLITLVQDKEIIDRRNLIFKALYQACRFKAKVNIPSGTLITSMNTVMETYTSANHPTNNSFTPYGQTATYDIRSGSIISPTYVKKKQKAILIKRNKTVRLIIKGRGWEIATIGTTLESGKTGELIKVKNNDTGRTVIGRIDENGNVVPTIARRRLRGAL